MYEIVFILPPDYSEDKRLAVLKDITKTITNRNGALVKTDFLGERDLKYPVKNLTRGIYYIIEFTIPVDHMAKLEKDLNVNKDVIRYLITKQDLKAVEKSEKSKDKDSSRSKDYSIVKSEDEQQKAKKVELSQLDEKLNEILN